LWFPVEKVLPRLLISIVLVSSLYSLVITGSFILFSLAETEGIDFLSRLTINTLNSGIFIIPWILIYYFFHYIERNRQQQMDTLKLSSMVKELELKTLKAHINPHFIFNALNSIRALIDENPARARKAITELSNMLRSGLQTDKLEFIPFERELNTVKDYLALEHIRFEDRLRIEYSIAENTLAQPVPPMMLQTLVENAIKHGIGKRVQGGQINIISRNEVGVHELIVQNSGILIPSRDEGFGLVSTQNRLQLLFGGKASLSIRQSEPDTVEAKLSLPIL
jgi:LytS/YehU family sensor histidine kinase